MAATPPPPLPEALLDFLSNYPHPCFALQASPLHAALTTRQTVGYSAASRDQQRRSKAAAASGDTEAGSQSTGNSNTASSRSKRSNADEILSTAFAQQAHSGPEPSAPPTHASLLEGGSQQSHHPSRTAEGAVAAMYEQRAVRKAAINHDEATEASLDQDKRVEREQKEAIERQAGDKWGGAARNIEDGEAGDRGRTGMGMNLEGLLKPVWANQRWEQLLEQKPVKEGEDKGPDINLVTLCGRADVQKLLALLVQIIAPSEAVDASSSSRSDNTISLTLKFPHYSANYRSSRQRTRIAVPLRANSATPNPDVKANAYNSTATSNSLSSSSGASSVSSSMNLDPEYNLQLIATWMEEQDLVVITTIATNIFPSSASSRKRASTKASNASANSHTKPSTARPKLSSLQPSPSRAAARPTTTEAPAVKTTISSSPSHPSGALASISEHGSSGSSSEGQGSRPPLARQASRDSASSGVTVQPLSEGSLSSAPTPTPSHPGTRAHSQDAALLPSPSFAYSSGGTLSPAILAPARQLSPALSTDQVPTPIPDYTGQPHYDPEIDAEAARVAALLLGHDDEVIDPHKAFIVERRKRRRARRDREKKDAASLAGVVESGTVGEPGQDRELTHEEEKVEGAREREARKWREEQDARDDSELDAIESAAEQSERDDLDEMMDRELDALRAGSDLESSTEEGRISRRFGRSEENDLSEVETPEEPSAELTDSEPPSPLSTANLQVQQRGAMADPYTTPAAIDTFLEVIKRTPTGRLIATHPWEKTSLGGIRYWPAELRSMVSLVVFPSMFMY